MTRTAADWLTVGRAHPSVVAGVVGLVVFGASLLVLSATTSMDLGVLLAPFTVGFLVFMLFYFVVMIYVEPWLRH